MMLLGGYKTCYEKKHEFVALFGLYVQFYLEFSFW